MADKSPLQIISEQLPQFWQGEQAAGARGFIKGLGDLLGISSASEPESVMSRYPSEENALRAMTPLAAVVAPAARAAAPLARLAMRNPLTTGAALTYATEDPTNLIMNPIALAATYSPEAEAVVKPKGGNWLSQVENALKTLKSNQAFSASPKELAEELATYKPGSESYDRVLREIGLTQRTNAMNDWVSGPLTKYVKTYMGTPEDPVRKLAEQGILHVNPEELNIRPDWKPLFAEQQILSRSPTARAWEGASDLTINSLRQKDLSELTKLSDPWTTKLGPEEQVYGLLDPQNFGRDLGFQHLKDELRNAISPTSELPASLKLQPEDLKQMGMEKAVRHVAAINAWREAQQAEANLAKAMNPATHVVKEYPEGYKLVELKAPKELPEGWKQPEGGKGMFVDPEGNPTFESPLKASLEEALKYEGETMGHCVGGYCEDVAKGNSRIFSIRDAKGRPHVTIEVGNKYQNPRFEMPQDEQDALQERLYREALRKGIPEDSDAMMDYVEGGMQDAATLWAKEQEKNALPRIVQIKGKGNKAPAEKYLPMVQDFIRSQEWGGIGDLANSGLMKGPSGKLITRQEMLKLYEDLPDTAKSMSMVQERINWLKEGSNPDYDYQDNLRYITQNSWGRYADGGSVQPAHFDDLSAFLSRKN